MVRRSILALIARSQGVKLGADNMDKQTIISKILPIISAADNDYNKMAYRSQGLPVDGYYAHIAMTSMDRIMRPEYVDATRNALNGATSSADACNRIADVMIATMPR